MSSLRGMEREGAMSSGNGGSAAGGYEGRIEQISASRGGVPKRAVPEAVVNRLGLAGDAQRDRRHHGGPERAVCLWSAEQVDALRAAGHPIQAGAAGENVTLRSVDWKRVIPGARVHLGDSVIVEVTSYAAPCKTIAHVFSDGDFNRINQQAHPGTSRVYARVAREGVIRAGDRAAVERDSAGDRAGRVQPRTLRWRPPA